MVARLHDFVRHHLHFFADFVVAPSHEALDRINRVLRIGDRLALRHLSDQPFPVLVKPTTDGRGPATFFVRDNLGSPPSITATQELVVPRSIPIILPIKTLLS